MSYDKEVKAEDTGKFIIGMRDAFFDRLYTHFEKDRNLSFVSADNGAPTLDKYVDSLPGQFFNVGIAEAQMVGMAAGLAIEGKKSYCYAIAPFVTTRVHEQVKVDLCAQDLDVTLVGVGAGYAYDIMGPTHHTAEDISIMRALPNMRIYSPADSYTAAALADITIAHKGPQYVRFDRAGIAPLYADKSTKDFEDGVLLVKPGKDVAIIATGIMVHQAIQVAERLEKEAGLSVAVIDVFRVKPMNFDKIMEIIREVPHVVTAEEHLLSGGMGSIVAEHFVDEGVYKPLLRVGMRDTFVFDYGGREVIWKNYGLDVDSIFDRVRKWTKSKAH